LSQSLKFTGAKFAIDTAGRFDFDFETLLLNYLKALVRPSAGY